MVSIVAAIGRNRELGKDNRLLWHVPDDLKRFKALTTGHPVIMGRRTWESLGRAFAGRENIVVSRAPGFEAPGAAVAASLGAALALCAGEKVAFVIGGTELFAAALPLASGMVLTEIHRDYAGDARFPPYDRSRWRESQRERHTAADGTKFDFVLYERPVVPA